MNFDPSNPALEWRRIQLATVLMSSESISKRQLVRQMDRLFADSITLHGFLGLSETVVINGTVKHWRPFRHLVEHARSSGEETCRICDHAHRRGISVPWWDFRYGVS